MNRYTKMVTILSNQGYEILSYLFLDAYCVLNRARGYYVLFVGM